MVIQKTMKVIDSFVIRNEEIVTKKMLDRFLGCGYNAFKKEPIRYKKKYKTNKQDIRNKQLPRNF